MISWWTPAHEKQRGLFNWAAQPANSIEKDGTVLMALKAGRRRDISNLQTLLASLVEQTKGEQVSIEDLLNAVGRRAFGPILILLGFIAISPLTIVPGTSWLVALVTLLFAGQVAVGQARP